MENASKALLIAGAVLIVIVLISVGMAIVGSATSVTDQVGDTTATQTVTAFNKAFDSYAGSQRGSAVKTLLQTISTSNATNSSTSGHVINVTITDSQANNVNLSSTNNSTAILKAGANIVTSAKYTVTMATVDAEGYITSITITR